jgi:hypothetical protein
MILKLDLRSQYHPSDKTALVGCVPNLDHAVQDKMKTYRSVLQIPAGVTVDAIGRVEPLGGVISSRPQNGEKPHSLSAPG